MRAVGLIAGGVIGAILIAVAAKTAGAATVTPTKPKTPARPVIATVGLPGEVAKIIKEAMASNDPVAIREAAFRISDLYALQAADLLNLATIIEGEPTTIETGGATGTWGTGGATGTW